MKSAWLSLIPVLAAAAEPQAIPIWPGPAPGSEAADYEETVAVRQDGLRRVANVTRPVLLAYLPDPKTATGTAVIICPGGAFAWLAIEHEGSQVASRLNAIGVAAFVLKYRVMRTSDVDEKEVSKVMPTRRKQAMEWGGADGLQAIRVVRSRADEWGVRKNRIGIIGFSAGGFVAAWAAMNYDAASRPDFAAPIYPATPDPIVVPTDAPPLFLAHASDDGTVPIGRTTLRLYDAWQSAKVPAEMHVYSKGGHGFGMKKSGLPVDTWADRYIDWLRLLGMTTVAQP